MQKYLQYKGEVTPFPADGRVPRYCKICGGKLHCATIRRYDEYTAEVVEEALSVWCSTHDIPARDFVGRR